MSSETDGTAGYADELTALKGTTAGLPHFTPLRGPEFPGSPDAAAGGVVLSPHSPPPNAQRFHRRRRDGRKRVLRRPGAYKDAWEAARLHVIGGWPLAEVARHLGIPVSTVKRWAVEQGWDGMREEAEAKTFPGVFRLAMKALALAQEKTHHQSIYAFTCLAEMVGLARELPVEELRLRHALEFWQFVLEAVKRLDPAAGEALAGVSARVIEALEARYAPAA